MLQKITMMSCSQPTTLQTGSREIMTAFTSPPVDTEAEVIPTITGNTKTISRTDVTTVNVERSKYPPYVYAVQCEAVRPQLIVVDVKKILAVQDSRPETDALASHSNVQLVTKHPLLRQSLFSCRIPHKPHGCLPTAAIMAYSLAGVLMIQGRFSLTNAVVVILPVSRRRCSSRRNIFVSR